MNKSVRLSDHAHIRMQQRAIPEKFIPLILEYGEGKFVGSGCQEWRLNNRVIKKLRKDLKAILNQLDSLSNAYVIEGKDGSIVTLGHKYR
jgi:hypothetical protein